MKLCKIVVKDIRGKYDDSEVLPDSYFADVDGKIDVKGILMLVVKEYYSDLKVKGFTSVATSNVVQSAALIHKIQTEEAKAQKLLEAEQGEYSDYIDVPQS